MSDGGGGGETSTPNIGHHLERSARQAIQSLRLEAWEDLTPKMVETSGASIDVAGTAKPRQ
jgi:hypothetical protein